MVQEDDKENKPDKGIQETQRGRHCAKEARSKDPKEVSNREP